MAITCTLLTGGTSDADATSYTTASVTFTSGRAYVIGVEIGRTGAATENPVISGTTSGTWTNIGPAQFNTVATSRSRVQVKYFKASSTFAEAISIATTTSHNGCRWIIAEIDGYDSAAVFPVQTSAAVTGDAGTSATATLAAFASAGNLSLGFFGVDIGAAPFTAGGSFTLLNQRSGTAPAESLGCVYYVGDADPSVTFASADYGGIALEVAELVAAGGQPIVKRRGGTPGLNLQPNPLGPRIW